MHEQRISKVRLVDVAKAVGVSLTTVDRVLNGRGGVRGETAERIERAIKDLGFVPNLAAKSLSRPEDLNFLFLLPGTPTGVTGYMMLLEDAIGAVARSYVDFRVNVTVRRSQPFDDAALAAAIDAAAGTCHGIAFVALDTPPVCAAVNRALRQDVRVVTLVSDLAVGEKVTYVGVANHAAGRCAGFLLSRFLRGGDRPAVAIVTGSDLYRAHRHREAGFRDSFYEGLPNAELITVTDVRNDGNNSYRAVTDLLRQRDDIAGIYSIGAGNRGIILALRERGGPSGKLAAKPVFVAHELTPHTRAGVRDGLVDAIVAQDAHLLADTAIRSLLEMGHLNSGDLGRNISVPSIYVRDNIL